ncbi:uncharacterized protein tacc isoform X2 [Venturia canescens]|uniref:uncharacterized protein tacc isoform X2 n=1 Tax=Venturia canescens TaxID=32260 RepID=UPI001C9C3EFD|nr:uncharacterized protein LOC122416358 isoform X2 [Venturia canescens]
MDYINRLFHRNSPNTSGFSSPELEGSNEGSTSKIEPQQQQPQHDVKVRFIREFADAPSTTIREGIPECSSLSSASSFQSLASTLSSKCSSGICVDSSPNKSANNSYLSPEIKGLDDLIAACENIHLNDSTKEQSFELRADSEDNSPDATFTSAADNTSLDRSRGNSPINLKNDVDPSLNVTADINRPISPINQADSTDPNLNTTTEITEPKSSIDNEAHCNPDIPRDIEKDPSEPDFNFNVATEIHNERHSPVIRQKEENTDLNVTTEIQRENHQQIEQEFGSDLAREIEKTSALSSSQGNSILNVTTDAINDNFVNDCPDGRDLDSTRVISSNNSPIKCSVDFNLNLDSTRIISNDDSSNKCPNNFTPDLDTTREVTREFSELNREARGIDKPQIFYENAISSSTQLHSHTPEFVDALCTSSELEKSDGTFVQCVSDIAQLSEPKETDVALKDLDFAIESTEILKSTVEESKEELKGYEDYPLELITPSLSQFHENLCAPNFESINESDISAEKNFSKFSAQDLKITKQTDNFVDESKELIKENTESWTIPTLPTLSSIHSPIDLNESTNLRIQEASIQEIDHSNENNSQRSLELKESENSEENRTEGCSISEKFAAPLTIENCLAKPLTNFISAYNLVDGGVGVCDPDTEEYELTTPAVPVPLKLSKIINCTVPKITCHSVKDLIQQKLRKEKIQGEEFNLSRKINRDSNNPELLTDNEIDHLESGTVSAEIETESFPEITKKQNGSNDELDTTVTADDLDIDDFPESDQFAEFVPQRQSTGFEQLNKLEPQKSTLIAGATEEHNFVRPPVPLNENYEEFRPQKQSTSLNNFTSPVSSKPERQRTHYLTALSEPEESSINEKIKSTPNKQVNSFDHRCNFEQLEVAANSVANDIFNSSLDLPEENEHYVSAQSEVFQDPSNFEFFLSKTPKRNTNRNLRDLSLYVKFDPLVSNTSMLPQGNIQSASPPTSEARNGENNTAVPNVGTPKRNPAIAAIDRLLFYSPMSGNATPTNTSTTTQKTNDGQEKLKSADEATEDTINMAKELELVRTTVLQLEEQLEKLKIDHEEALDKQASYKEKINQLQTQLAQEVKHKNEITVVVDEYEISISRLVAERERDRKNLDLEKAKLQEELAAAKHHLDNTEAAFNDVHLKYERLKAVVATYKNNEAELKKSIQENVEIIKSLENRYEQVKSHATARLEKANLDLEEIRKQNDSETVRLRAMLRKAELKSNSLAELVEQKTKENNQLTQILDELIARVGVNKSE